MIISQMELSSSGIVSPEFSSSTWMITLFMRMLGWIIKNNISCQTNLKAFSQICYFLLYLSCFMLSSLVFINLKITKAIIKIVMMECRISTLILLWSPKGTTCFKMERKMDMLASKFKFDFMIMICSCMNLVRRES